MPTIRIHASYYFSEFFCSLHYMEQRLQAHRLTPQHTVSALAGEHSRQCLAPACYTTSTVIHTGAAGGAGSMMVDRRASIYKSVSLQTQAHNSEPASPRARAFCPFFPEVHELTTASQSLLNSTWLGVSTAFW